MVLLLLVGCSCPEVYVKAERAVYETAGAEWIAYVASDSRLADGDRNRKRRLYLAWGARITAEEARQ